MPCKLNDLHTLLLLPLLIHSPLVDYVGYGPHVVTFLIGNLNTNDIWWVYGKVYTKDVTPKMHLDNVVVVVRRLLHRSVKVGGSQVQWAKMA